jgi:hypothetical protein
MDGDAGLFKTADRYARSASRTSSFETKRTGGLSLPCTQLALRLRIAFHQKRDQSNCALSALVNPVRLFVQAVLPVPSFVSRKNELRRDNT